MRSRTPTTGRLCRLAAAGAGVATGVAIAAAAAQDAAPSSAPLNPLSSLRPSDFQAFRERPLFTPSRRPPPIVPSLPERAPPVRAEVEDEPPNVRLTGVVHGAAAPMAVLQRPDAGGTTTVRIGDDVEGWAVAAIDSVGVRLVRGTRAREYRLFARDSLPVTGPDHATVGNAGSGEVR